MKASLDKLESIDRMREAIERRVEKPKKVMAKKPWMGLSLKGPSATELAPVLQPREAPTHLPRKVLAIPDDEVIVVSLPLPLAAPALAPTRSPTPLAPTLEPALVVKPRHA